MADETLILTEVRGTLGVITLNRPRAINSLSLEMLQGIDRALTDFQHDSRVAAVLITGAGERGLCAGGDIVALHRHITAGEHTEIEEYFRAEYSLNYRISTYPKPIIALMDGVVLGGGVGVSAHASHRIVTERSRVGMPETIIGFAPDIGALKLLSAAPRQLGTMMAMTGTHALTSDALVTGLADYYVPSEKIDELLKYLQTATDAQSIELVIDKFVAEPPASRFAENATWIAKAFAGNDPVTIRDRVVAEAEGGNEFAAELVKALEHNSPTGISMALVGVRRAKTATLAETLNADLIMAVNSATHHDLREGIRAQVIDKDRNPSWEYDGLESVPAGYAAEFYTAPEGLKPLGLK